MAYMRCRRCRYFCYDFFSDDYEFDASPFCGLHGRAPVDPDGLQVSLNHRGSCGFCPRISAVQLSLEFTFNP